MSLSEACGAHSKRYAEKRPRSFAEPRWLANLGFRDTSSAGNPPTTQGKRIRGEITSSKGQELITSSYNKQQGASFGSLGKQFGASFMLHCHGVSEWRRVRFGSLRKQVGASFVWNRARVSSFELVTAKIWKDILLCYAAPSANTKCKAGVLSVLSCVASNARLKRGPSGIVVQRQDT